MATERALESQSKDGLAIDVEQLVKTFETGRRKHRRAVEAVRGVDLRVRVGERIAFIGPNGAGKSTSIKILTGILHPTSGRAEVLGIVPWLERRRLARRIGVLFGQRSQLWADLTARQGLSLLGALYGFDRRSLPSRIEEVADLLDAADLLDQPSRTFSLGQRMRCELAAAMLHAPEILFLDEPTIGLDLVAKQTFRELIARLNAESHTTIFLTSHDVSDIEAVTERVVIVNHGVIIYDDAVRALRGSLLATKLVDIRFEEERAFVPTLGVDVLSYTPTTCELRIDTRRVAIRALLDDVLERYPVIDISVADPPLEDVITQIYAGHPT